MTLKKWVYLIIALAITGYILFFYISFNGNPISKAVAKNYASDYLEKYYPEQNYSIKDSGYNFKDQSYSFHYIVNEKNDQVYNYSIEIGKGLKPDEVIYHSLRYDSEDVEMSSTFSEAGTTYVQKLLTEAKLDSEVYYYVQVPLGYVDRSAEWKPKLELPVNADIHVYTEKPFTSKKEFFQYVKTVINELDEVLYKELYIENTLSETTNGSEIAYKITIEYDEDITIENVWAVE